MAARPTVTRDSIRESYPRWKAHFDLVGGLWNYVVARPLSFYVTPGNIARYQSQCSRLGGFLDSLADRQQLTWGETGESC